ncbi:RNA-binding domain-containing protein [Cantharellus anzutake]|uniref:RNA-binding domain-containing protein n=1 Tax=Cantharellus anzutake TaxID=1750568 RepID=UPI001906C47D|nr:RNA-binding domain-containing protein [Cantharellus anzutake]KAF8334312.1 RNA-binding domain-containing protein [Cantharellus anzutake]
MEDGAKSKKTIFIGGLSEEADQEALINAFSTFGDIIDIQIPTASSDNRENPNGIAQLAPGPHRGYAFITYSNALDAQDAIDNMDLNVFRQVRCGRVIRVNLARPQKGALAQTPAFGRAIWESEEWLKTYARPVQSIGTGSKSPGEQDEQANGAMEE